MNWLFWQQHRKQLLVFGVLLLIFAAITVPTGSHFWHHYQQLTATCSQTNSCNQADVRDAVFATQFDGLVTNFVKLSLLGLPLLFGLFWGAPLLSKEYADNTNKLVWTQGVSRRKWLAAKLGWALLATILLAGAFSALATWFSHTGNVINHNRFDFVAFSSQGIVPIATAVFAVALGVATGAWLKKLLPALGITLGLLVVLQVAVPLLVRTHYTRPHVYTTASLTSGDKNGDPFKHPVPNNVGAWIISDKMVNASGKVFSWENPPSSCKVAEPGTGKQEENTGSAGDNKADKVAKRDTIIGKNNTFVDIDCLNTLGYHWEIKYQPSYRYWNFQNIESALYLVLALIPLTATYWLVLRRDA